MITISVRIMVNHTSPDERVKIEVEPNSVVQTSAEIFDDASKIFNSR